jgi:septal ring factor EnvC (AmiA/AmiB activator)
MEGDVKELSTTNKEQASKIVSLQNDLKGKNSAIRELELRNYELDQELKTHEINEKNLDATIALLNGANDNFKALLEKYRFLLENNTTVRKRSISTKRVAKTEKK